MAEKGFTRNSRRRSVAIRITLQTDPTSPGSQSTKSSRLRLVKRTKTPKHASGERAKPILTIQETRSPTDPVRIAWVICPRSTQSPLPIVMHRLVQLGKTIANESSSKFLLIIGVTFLDDDSKADLQINFRGPKGYLSAAEYPLRNFYLVRRSLLLKISSF